MKNSKIVKKHVIGITILTLLFSNAVTVSAAGKTIEAFKNNTYSGTSDCQVMINGVKSQDSSYTSLFKNKNSSPAISQSDFIGKSRCIKYWASHGNNSGQLWGDSGVSFNIFNINNFKWSGSNLEFVFLAACNQLDGANQNPRAKYANAMIGNKAVRVVCGYHEGAPQAGQNHDAYVAQKFINKAKTGESVKSSWIQANQLYGNNYYCVLTHSGNVQYSRFPGFPGLTYTRPGSSSTTILRFSAANPGGTNQPLTSGGSSFNTFIQNIDIPNYSIKATNNDISVKADVKTTVLKMDDYMTTQNGEIGDKKVQISDKKAVSMAEKWLTDVYSGVTIDDFKDAEFSVIPIVMAEVNLDGHSEKEIEVVVAYDISFNSKFNGIPIKGDRYCAIVDDSGVSSSAVCHRNYIVINNDDPKISNDKEIIKEKLVSYGVNIEKIVNASIMFMDEDGDGIFDPIISVRTSDGKTTMYNTITGKLSVG